MNRDQNASFRSSGLFIPERTIFPVQTIWKEKDRAITAQEDQRRIQQKDPKARQQSWLINAQLYWQTIL